MPINIHEAIEVNKIQHRQLHMLYFLAMEYSLLDCLRFSTIIPLHQVRGVDYYIGRMFIAQSCN